MSCSPRSWSVLPLPCWDAPLRGGLVTKRYSPSALLLIVAWVPLYEVAVLQDDVGCQVTGLTVSWFSLPAVTAV